MRRRSNVPKVIKSDLNRYPYILEMSALHGRCRRLRDCVGRDMFTNGHVSGVNRSTTVSTDRCCCIRALDGGSLRGVVLAITRLQRTYWRVGTVRGYRVISRSTPGHQIQRIDETKDGAMAAMRS